MPLKIPRANQSTMEFFRSLVPEDSHVKVRPMFGNASAFVNGNMFFGVFGNDLFLRLSDGDRAELLKKKGSSLLEPVKGRPMRDYVIVPRAWWDEPATVRSWILRSLAWTGKLPPKNSD